MLYTLRQGRSLLAKTELIPLSTQGRPSASRHIGCTGSVSTAPSGTVLHLISGMYLECSNESQTFWRDELRDFIWCKIAFGCMWKTKTFANLIIFKKKLLHKVVDCSYIIKHFFLLISLIAIHFSSPELRFF
jgi:hypothetical protein